MYQLSNGVFVCAVGVTNCGPCCHRRVPGMVVNNPFNCIPLPPPPPPPPSKKEKMMMMIIINIIIIIMIIIMIIIII